jgi:hypothetical protein
MENIMSELRIVKLSTGEEILGNIVEKNGVAYRIEHPCVLGIMMGPNGKANLQMQPMLIFSDQKVVEINREHIIYEVSVANELKNKYNEVYGSGIVVPPKQSLII